METVKIFVARHGQTPLNAVNCMQGQIDVELSELGKRQAEELKERLKEENFEHIYTSPLIRAYDTAKKASEYHDCPFKTDDRIKEMNFGEWEGNPIEKVKSEGGEPAYYFWNEPHNFHITTGETFYQLIDRVGDFLDMIVEEHKGQKVLIVCHGMVVRAILTYVQNRDVSEMYNNPPIRNASITVFDYDGKNANIEVISDDSHITKGDKGITTMDKH